MGRPKKYTPVESGPSREEIAVSDVADGALGVIDAAKFCGHGKRWIYKEIEDGRLPSFFLGRRRLIAKKVLVAFLAQAMVADAPRRPNHLNRRSSQGTPPKLHTS